MDRPPSPFVRSLQAVLEGLIENSDDSSDGSLPDLEPYNHRVHRNLWFEAPDPPMVSRTVRFSAPTPYVPRLATTRPSSMASSPPQLSTPMLSSADCPIREAARVARDGIAAAAAARPRPVLKRTTPSSSSSSSSGEPSKRKRRRVACMREPQHNKPPPSTNLAAKLKNDADYEEPGAEHQSSQCCICICQPEQEEVSSINGCEHLFCFKCIGKWAERENTCPLCKTRFSKISRVNPAKGSSRKSPNSKTVKNRDQRSDYISAGTLEGLLERLTGSALMYAHARTRATVVTQQLGPRTSSTGTASASVTFAISDPFFDSDESNDEGLTPFQLFLRARNASRGGFNRGTLFAVPYGGSSAPTPAAAASRARSYASNGNEALAGSNSNPLEIDDDSDDEVEVVGVALPRM